MKTVGGEYCAAIGCKNNRNAAKMENKLKSFFRFPRDPERCKIWVINSRRADLLSKEHFKTLWKRAVICQDHFEAEMFSNPPKGATIKRINKTAIPTIFKVPTTVKSRVSLNSLTSAKTQNTTINRKRELSLTQDIVRLTGPLNREAPQSSERKRRKGRTTYSKSNCSAPLANIGQQQPTEMTPTSKQSPEAVWDNYEPMIVLRKPMINIQNEEDPLALDSELSGESKSSQSDVPHESSLMKCESETHIDQEQSLTEQLEVKQEIKFLDLVPQNACSSANHEPLWENTSDFGSNEIFTSVSDQMNIEVRENVYSDIYNSNIGKQEQLVANLRAKLLNQEKEIQLCNAKLNTAQTNVNIAQKKLNTAQGRLNTAQTKMNTAQTKFNRTREKLNTVLLKCA